MNVGDVNGVADLLPKMTGSTFKDGPGSRPQPNCCWSENM